MPWRLHFLIRILNSLSITKYIPFFQMIFATATTYMNIPYCWCLMAVCHNKSVFVRMNRLYFSNFVFSTWMNLPEQEFCWMFYLCFQHLILLWICLSILFQKKVMRTHHQWWKVMMRPVRRFEFVALFTVNWIAVIHSPACPALSLNLTPASSALKLQCQLFFTLNRCSFWAVNYQSITLIYKTTRETPFSFKSLIWVTSCLFWRHIWFPTLSSFYAILNMQMSH